MAKTDLKKFLTSEDTIKKTATVIGALLLGAGVIIPAVIFGPALVGILAASVPVVAATIAVSAALAAAAIMSASLGIVVSRLMVAKAFKNSDDKSVKSTIEDPLHSQQNHGFEEEPEAEEDKNKDNEEEQTVDHQQRVRSSVARRTTSQRS